MKKLFLILSIIALALTGCTESQDAPKKFRCLTVDDLAPYINLTETDFANQIKQLGFVESKENEDMHVSG